MESKQSIKHITTSTPVPHVSKGEILKGMFVTVYEWKKKSIAIPPMQVNRAGCGDVFKVIAVNNPYVIVKNMFSKKGHTVDLRDTDLIELNKDYVEASNAVYDFVPPDEVP